MDENQNSENNELDVLKDPESIPRSVRSIRRYSQSVDDASPKQSNRLGAVDHLAHRVADEAEDLELNNVMEDEELEQIREIVKLATWSSLVNMRLLTEEVIENTDNDE